MRSRLSVIAPIRPAGAATGACLPVQWHAMRPYFFLYFAVICLCSASMRLHVRWVRNIWGGHFATAPLLCAPAGTVILGPWPTDGSPDPEHTSSARWGARAADRPPTSSAWDVCYPVQHGRAGLPSAGESRRCWVWPVCWARFT